MSQTAATRARPVGSEVVNLGNDLKGFTEFATQMRIEHLYRYPVKGLTAEALEEVHVEPGAALPWDRAFALAHGDAPFDPARPAWLPKSNFMSLLRHARIARLRSSFDPHGPMLHIRAPDGDAIAENPLTETGRERLSAWLTARLGEEARGTPRFHHVPGHTFADDKAPCVSLINLATLADFERRAGAPRDAMRFRANVYFSGAAPWSEFGWIEHCVLIGGAKLRITKRTLRCNATQVNPATGERDADPVRELRAAYGHADLGVLATVVEGGRFARGDALELLPS